MGQPPRLKSSFIYLANAVNDLRGNLSVLALVLAPPILISSLCLLPDAINIQALVARHFGAGVHAVAFIPAQMPYLPVSPNEPLPVPDWAVNILQITSIFVTLAVNLVVLCTLNRIQSGVREPTVVGEALAVYRRAIAMTPSFLWVVALQLLVIAVAVLLLLVPETIVLSLMYSHIVLDLRLIVLPAVLALFWIYFAQCALVLDGYSSFPALLYSRELVRGRFFRVATRFVVFLAMWSGYNAWAGGAFFLISRILGPVGVLTGTVGVVLFLIDLTAVAVAYATIAFFIAAGVRLYQDLVAFINQKAAFARGMAPLKTANLASLET
ncbi:MAG: hypothetical protein IVW54_06120 [Candidatus Binataceae bacterium]|nr:hypothetical protein [Candidatus Binataceae bacterium]